MTWITPIEMNMDISRSIYEEKSDHFLVATAQKIAIYTVIPMALIAAFEAVVKNLIVFNAANLGILLLNRFHAWTT